MGGGIGTANEPPPAPSAPSERLPGGWPLTLPPEPGSGLQSVGPTDFPDLERALHDPTPDEQEPAVEDEQESESEWSEDNIEL